MTNVVSKHYRQFLKRYDHHKEKHPYENSIILFCVEGYCIAFCDDADKCANALRRCGVLNIDVMMHPKMMWTIFPCQHRPLWELQESGLDLFYVHDDPLPWDSVLISANKNKSLEYRIV
jgi:hypothetical protein